MHTMSPIISMTLKYKLLTFKRNVNFAIVLGRELNSYLKYRWHSRTIRGILLALGLRSNDTDLFVATAEREKTLENQI